MESARDAEAGGAQPLPESPGGASTDPFRLDGKVVVVTGGSKGLGRAMALGFAEAGADVVVSSRKLDAVRGRRRRGARARAVARSPCRLPRRRLGRVRAAWSTRTVAEFGRIDVLVNNAGIAPVPPSLARCHRGAVRQDDRRRTSRGRSASPRWRRRTHAAGQHGSSTSARRRRLHPSPFTVVYAAAKAGLNALTKAIVAGVRAAGHPRQLHRLRHLPNRQLRSSVRRRGRRRRR